MAMTDQEFLEKCTPLALDVARTCLLMSDSAFSDFKQEMKEKFSGEHRAIIKFWDDLLDFIETRRGRDERRCS